MKKKVISALTVLLLFALTGCVFTLPVSGAPAAATGHVPSATVSTAPLISEEEALLAALEHAGLTKDQVTRIQIRLDYDDGFPEYEVEFYRDRVEYDYEINAATGKIISFDRDKE